MPRLVFGKGIQFAYADVFNCRHSLGERCRSVGAEILELSIFIVFLSDA